MAESISIEETNAIRKKLGLPLLAVEGSDDETVDPEREAYENYQKQKQEKEREAKEEKIRESIEKSKNRKRKLEKLQGKGLAEASDDEDESALAWIKKSRKRERELAARRAKELEEMDNAYQTYDAEQLAGLKVSHSLSEFQEGEETILTLKDRGILDEEDVEELTNVNLEDRERLKKNLEAKKQKPGYNPYDDDQFSGKKQSILPQYEEEEEENGFVIGNAGVVQVEKEKENEKTVSQKLKEQTLSYEKMQEIKDYYTQEEAEATFKKPKSKKKKKTRRKNKDDDDLNISTTASIVEDSPESTSTTASKSRTIDPDANFVDDDELQEALARSRRIANKQKSKLIKKMTPEEIARQLKEEQIKEEEDNDTGGLVLSETTEFVNSLGRNIPIFNPRETTYTVKSEEPKIKVEPDTERYIVHEIKDEPHSESEQILESEKEENVDHTMEDIKEEETMVEIKQEITEANNNVEEPLVEEPLVSRGLAATLSLLNQKGILAKPTEEQIKRDKIAAEQIRWQNEQRKKERIRELEDRREKERRRGVDRRDYNTERMRELEREREREREREEARRLREFELAMENYKPEVNLEYTDDSGRVMNTHEAFRYMSHKFHGKTSGKTKTEKRMKKIEEERRLNMMSSTDTPHNLANALLERQKRTGNAHVVLSIGNRGVVPTSTPLEGLSKSKDNSNNKK
ncbi:SART-1 protein [Cokeromyces recurvatus]|uniref:SART-1 protein n=1 Tax=Cokeromyces recurvatus TaxID=90255 RepID=UPI00221F088E|nr:SART-1 protein [Cokeromyces recurvatus]KAI7902716.1 SART-1 protein [Cokeromyces recurvatus]